MKIYIVIGACGEYSDHTEWMIAAYPVEAVAQKHVELATQGAGLAMTAHGVTRQGGTDDYPTYSGAYSIPKGVNPWDPEMQVDYTGIRYSLAEVQLHEASEPVKP